MSTAPGSRSWLCRSAVSSLQPQAASDGGCATVSAAALTCLMCANLVLLALWPACGVFLLARLHFSNWARSGAIACLALLGMVGMFGCLAVANRRLGSSWLFLLPSVQVGRVLMTQPNTFRVSGW